MKGEITEAGQKAPSEVRMNPLKPILALVALVLLSACADMPDITSRNAPFEALPATNPTAPATFAMLPMPASAAVAPAGEIATVAPQASALRVGRVDVIVPRDLSVSEANLYYPRADIVWRGDLPGDRHAQVQTIFEEAARRGVTGLDGPTEVALEIKVRRFHSVSEKARYSVGGVHNIVFDLTLRRAATGAPLAAPREVVISLPALGGNKAIEADRAGQTQKVRISEHLQAVIRQELARYVRG